MGCNESFGEQCLNLWPFRGVLLVAWVYLERTWVVTLWEALMAGFVHSSLGMSATTAVM